MAKREWHYYVGDFETVAYKGQEFTEVWASAVVELNTEDVKIFHSIDDTLKYLEDLNQNIVIWYHNLKFDGAFWLDYLLKQGKYKTDIMHYGTDPDDTEYVWNDENKMPIHTMQYTISDMGQWYTIRLKTTRRKIIEFRDSYKLLPFSVETIGPSFETKHRKLSMNYEGARYAGCEIKPEEREYIANDVLVVKEALELMLAEGHDKLTIGACCMDEYKKTLCGSYKYLFPDLSQIEVKDEYFSTKDLNKTNFEKTADAYIRHSYRGGWCYVVHGKENRMFYNGTTGDVNSLYPSMMSSESGNRYPIGTPMFWKGDIPDYVLNDTNLYWFVRFRANFRIKKNRLPFIQIKGSIWYDPTEMLESSFPKDKDGNELTYYTDEDGKAHDFKPELTMTKTDFILFCEQYDIMDLEILDGCYFQTEIGIFDTYINRYKRMKLTSKGAKRTLAKLFLNNLYGKMASSTNSSFKVAKLKDNKVAFFDVAENNKKAGFIAVGSAITSYARNFTIRAAQANYHGVDKPGFIYADTDSIHCDLKPNQMKGIKVHDKNFCCWKLESCWDKGIFVRQKTYIEHITQKNCEPVEPEWNIKCAGMPSSSKKLVKRALDGDSPNENDNAEAKDFLEKNKGMKMTDFKLGLCVPNKLLPRRIPGGIALEETNFQLR